MAVSKHIRSTVPETNPFFLEVFRKHQLSEDRERAWRDAVRLAGTGNPALRFPVYEHLHRLNTSAQEMIEVLEKLSGTFDIAQDSLLYHQSLIHYVRASVSQVALESMASVETTEAWLFQSQWLREQSRLRDPDDVYLSVRERESERINQGLPPRIQFLDDAASRPTSDSGKRTKDRFKNKRPIDATRQNSR
jgi:hypothetical protein